MTAPAAEAPNTSASENPSDDEVAKKQAADAAEIQRLTAMIDGAKAEIEAHNETIETLSSVIDNPPKTGQPRKGGARKGEPWTDEEIQRHIDVTQKVIDERKGSITRAEDAIKNAQSKIDAIKFEAQFSSVMPLIAASFASDENVAKVVDHLDKIPSNVAFSDLDAQIKATRDAAITHNNRLRILVGLQSAVLAHVSEENAHNLPRLGVEFNADKQHVLTFVRGSKGASRSASASPSGERRAAVRGKQIRVTAADADHQHLIGTVSTSARALVESIEGPTERWALNNPDNLTSTGKKISRSMPALLKTWFGIEFEAVGE